MRFPWLEAAITLYVSGLLSPFVYEAVVNLRQIWRWFRQERANHRAYMDGLAEGAGLDERDRREALRRRLRLE